MDLITYVRSVLLVSFHDTHQQHKYALTTEIAPIQQVHPNNRDTHFLQYELIIDYFEHARHLNPLRNYRAGIILRVMGTNRPKNNRKLKSDITIGDWKQSIQA